MQIKSTLDEVLGQFKALAERNRLRVVLALQRQGELCACQLTELLGVSGATASRHLGVLVASGVVESRKEGRWVYYSIVRAGRGDLVGWLNARLGDGGMEKRDEAALERILALDPEELCRQQRGEQCCPQPAASRKGAARR